MPTILTSGETVISPTICLSIETRRTAGNIVHDVVGRSDPDVTLRPAGTRTGTLRLGFLGASSEADSETAELALSGVGVWSILSDERESLAFSFIVAGRIERVLDDITRDDWIVVVEFREVTVS